MPQHASAKKAHRKSEKQRLINRSQEKRIKTTRKKFLQHLENNEMKEAQVLFIETQSLIAKAAKRGLFHRNKSARLISRMAKKINAKAN